MDWNEMTRAEALSVPDRLSVDLEKLILDGKLLPGEKLPPERTLVAMLGVSRVSLRQALHELESRGLIDRKPGRGTIVLSPGESARASSDALSQALHSVEAATSELAHIMELRAILEPPIAGITAGRASPRDVAQLRELVLEMETDVSRSRYAELDRAFHQSIAQYTHNPLLAMLNEQISILIQPSRHTSLQTKNRRKSSTVAHRKIYEAIAANDHVLAEHEAREHVLAVGHEIVRAEQANSEKGR